MGDLIDYSYYQCAVKASCSNVFALATSVFCGTDRSVRTEEKAPSKRTIRQGLNTNLSHGANLLLSIGPVRWDRRFLSVNYVPRGQIPGSQKTGNGFQKLGSQLRVPSCWVFAVECTRTEYLPTQHSVFCLSSTVLILTLKCQMGRITYSTTGNSTGSRQWGDFERFSCVHACRRL